MFGLLDTISAICCDINRFVFEWCPLDNEQKNKHWQQLDQLNFTVVLNCRQVVRITRAIERAGGTIGAMYCRRASGRYARGAPGYHTTTTCDGYVACVGTKQAVSAFQGLYPH